MPFIDLLAFFAKVNKDLKKIKNKKAKVTASVSGQAKLKRLSSDMKRVKNKRARVTASVACGLSDLF